MVFPLRQIVARCLDGDQSAMLELVERFQGQVFALCYRMLGQRQDAEDAAQETFVRVLRNLHRWDSQRDFEPWLLAIAGNRCRTALARRRRRPAFCPLAEPLDDGSSGLEFNHQLLVEEVQLALQALRPEYRQVFVLFHEHQLSYEEISTAVQRPLGTVKTWIHRARLEMIRWLQDRHVLGEVRSAVP